MQSQMKWSNIQSQMMSSIRKSIISFCFQVHLRSSRSMIHACLSIIWQEEGGGGGQNIKTSKLNKPLLCYVSICVYHYIHIIYIWSVSTQIPPNTPLTADIFSFIKHLLQTHRLLCISGYDIHIIIMKLPHSNNCQGTV